MKQKTIYPKVAIDMFLTQSKWTFRFLAIVFLIHVSHMIIALNSDRDLGTYFDSVFVATNIYMFIIGIIATYFLPHFVSLGVTRKDAYLGTVIGAAGLSIAIPIISFIVSSIAKWIVLSVTSLTFTPSNINSVVAEMDMEDHILGTIISNTIQTFIGAPYVDPSSNLLLALIIASLNFFVYYLIGWLIGSTFYRFGTIIGLVFIVIGIVILLAKNILLRIPLDLPLPEHLQFTEDISKLIATLLIVLLIGIVIGIIRMMTQRVSIKM